MNFTDRLCASKAAIQRGSAAEMLSMHSDGLVSSGEVLEAAYGACYCNPSLRAVLLEQLLTHPDPDIADSVGQNLQELLAELKMKDEPDA